MIVFLLGSTVYITILLNDTGPTAATAVKKTKAASLTYTKTLALNTQTVQPTESPPLSEPTAVPTEILLSYNSIDQTDVPTQPPVVPTIQTEESLTAAPTGVTSLPQSGWMQSSIAIFAAASIFIFLSFLY